VGTYSYGNSSGEQTLPYAVKEIQPPATGVQEIERLELSYTSYNKIESIVQTRGNKMAEFTYGANEQRAKMVLKEHNKAYKTKYYVGAYEKEITPEGVRELHYIDGVGIYVLSSSGVHEMYYTHKDHLGSINEITDSQGAVVERLSYDAWGNRRNSHTWEYDSGVDNFLFDRGYTGHEHLDDFAIINMNGRIYDPLTGRMMAPDNYVQSSLSQNLNRYPYCLNNPLIYTDPDGDFILLAAAAWLFFTESGYEVQKYISPVAVKVDVHLISSEQKGVGINASVGMPKLMPVSYRAHAGATYYWDYYDDSYKGWEKRYGGEWTFGGIVNYSGTTFISGETSQTLNSITIGTPFINFKYENDYMFNAGKYFIGVPAADGGDRYRTAAARLQLGFLKIGVNLFTGDPGLDKDDRLFPVINGRETYIIGKKGDDPDKYRAGVLYVGIGPMRIGRNSEKIRNTFQNKFAHDFMMGGDSPYFKVDKTRNPAWHFYLGTGTGNTLW